LCCPWWFSHSPPGRCLQMPCTSLGMCSGAVQCPCKFAFLRLPPTGLHAGYSHLNLWALTRLILTRLFHAFHSTFSCLFPVVSALWLISCYIQWIPPVLVNELPEGLIYVILDSKGPLFSPLHPISQRHMAHYAR
jgi:hypothetical protein